jgi:hypothetical protein
MGSENLLDFFLLPDRELMRLIIVCGFLFLTRLALASECIDIGLKIMGDSAPVAAKEMTTSQIKVQQEPVLRDIASYEGPLSEFEAGRLANPSLSRTERNLLKQEIQAAKEKIQEIRRTYPELANLERKDEGNIVTLISKLEEKGVSRQKIRDELKLEGLACEVP